MLTDGLVVPKISIRACEVPAAVKLFSSMAVRRLAPHLQNLEIKEIKIIVFLNIG